MTSNLSPGNIARVVYDPANEAIRVTIIGSGSPTLPSAVRLSDGVGYLTTTVSGAQRALDVNIINEIEIAIDHTEDSIRLGDGTNYISSTLVGSKTLLDVNVQKTSTNTFIYNEITNLVSGITSPIVNYVIPSSVTGRLVKCIVSGTNRAEYTVDVNSVTQDKHYTSFGNYGHTFDFYTGLSVEDGDVITVNVIHDRPFTGDFNVKLVIEEDL